MSAQQKEVLQATIYKMSDVTPETLETLSRLSDEELEILLTDLLRK